MADAPILTISTDLWSKRLAEYTVGTGKNSRAALTEEWPLLIRQIINLTPPFRTKGQPSGQSDLSIGRKAVSHDIYKTMRPFNPADVKSKSILKIIEKRDIAAFNAVAANARSGPLLGAIAVDFQPYLHTNERNRRGRVQGQDKNRVVIGSDAKLLTAYVTKIQSHVGYAKSGWAAAYNLVRDPDGAVLPNWVTRQGTEGGAVMDQRGDPDNPSVTAINHTPWAVRKDEWARIKADAFFIRAKALAGKLKTALRLARSGAGFSGREAA